MKRSIILFVNAFEPQQNIIDYGVFLAKSFELQLLLYSVHYTPVPIYSEPGLGTIGTTIMERPPVIKGKDSPIAMEEKGRQALEDLCKQVQKRWSLTRSEYVEGFSVTNMEDKSNWLLEKAEEQNPMFIIMGKEHDYIWWNRLADTIETEVAEKAHCPVIIVPPSVIFRGIKQISYLLDDEELQSGEMPNLQWLTLFGSKFNATLSFLYLPGKEKLPSEKLEEAILRIQSLSLYQTQMYKQMPIASSVEDIIKFIATTPIDLMTFPYRKHSFLKQLFGQDESRRLILKSTVPVMVF